MTSHGPNHLSNRHPHDVQYLWVDIGTKCRFGDEMSVWIGYACVGRGVLSLTAGGGNELMGGNYLSDGNEPYEKIQHNV